MLKNYFKIAIRNLWRTKSFTILNVLGLAIGMASAALILLWVHSEYTFDRFYANTDRLYKAYNRDSFDGLTIMWDRTTNPLGPALKKDYPEVERTSRYTKGNLLLSITDHSFSPDGAYADSGFFSLFDFEFIHGNKGSALHSVSGIVITQSLAKKLFGRKDAIGKIITVNNSDNFTVTHVIKDLPDNSHFRNVEYLLPWSYLEKLGLWLPKDSWARGPATTFVLLDKNADILAVNTKINSIYKTYAGEDIALAADREIVLHPAEKWHLYAEPVNGELIGGQQLRMVQLFIAIAGFILLIACINFMNLSTARSEKRAKEVGIRKVMGSRKHTLVGQFLGESILLTIIAGILAYLILVISLPAFNTLVQKELSLETDNPHFWLLTFGVILFTGILAGSYPAFFLSSFRPIHTLKGSQYATQHTFSPRKILVVCQFTFSILLIACTLIIRNQIAYGQARDTGYDRNNLIRVTLTGKISENYNIIRQRLLDERAAIALTKSLGSITGWGNGSFGFSWRGSTEADTKQVFVVLSTDIDFQAAMGVQIVQGRDIDVYTYATDSAAILLNEAAVKDMRLERPIGEVVRHGEEAFTVVGVVADFIMDSPYEPVWPLMVFGPPMGFNFTYIKLNPQNSTAENLTIAEKIFKEYNPGYPFEYQFVDEAYAQNFNDEQQIATLTGLFSGLTIFISCLGLFGLAAYMAEQRSKEIGIRKVLGATISGIVRLLSTEFVKLVAIAFIIASPIAYYLMNRWLQHFAYRISFEWDVFAITGALAVAIAIVTVSFQAIRAAIANPVESLRDE
ncbi:ABC transporter permease [Parapedobacter lycopersici]|uniref:ABC transporter permease n=1 Tax=Parapedobacter lycopersici TaxID=1864939 RepID=UPI00214D561C|nr:ABC transporter permease [Parapedobacter lycopersici]